MRRAMSDAEGSAPLAQCTPMIIVTVIQCQRVCCLFTDIMAIMSYAEMRIEAPSVEDGI